MGLKTNRNLFRKKSKCSFRILQLPNFNIFTALQLSNFLGVLISAGDRPGRTQVRSTQGRTKRKTIRGWAQESATGGGLK